MSKLITFPPSLDCELARFMLSHYRIPYEEERHALLFAPLYTLWRAHSVLFPAFVEGEERLGGARAMVDALDPRAPSKLQIVPGGELREQFEKDWQALNLELGAAVATFGYYHLLQRRDIMVGPLSDGTPTAERRSVDSAYLLYAGTLGLLLRLTPERATQALDAIHRIVEDVDARLADGRRYLLDNRFTMSDMIFAVSLAPLVLPDGYGAPLPPMSEMPPAMRNAIAEMREHPAGQFALRIYRDHRTPARDAAADGDVVPISA